MSMRLAYAESLVDKTGTKNFQRRKFRGEKEVSGMGNVSCLTSAFLNASSEGLMTEKRTSF